MSIRIGLALGAVLSAPGSAALALLPISPNYGSLPQVINTICIPCVKIAPGADPTPRPAGPIRAPAAVPAGSTRYVPSPAVSAEVKAAFVQRAARTVSPDQARKIAAALAGLDVPAAWSGVVASDGLRPGDVADAMASYYVANWVVANQADNTPAQTLAVRDSVRRALAGPLVRVPNADRQRYAESAMLGFLLTLKPYADARKSGDAAAARRLSDQAEASFRAATNTDLRRLSLTDRGFVPRT